MMNCGNLLKRAKVIEPRSEKFEGDRKNGSLGLILSGKTKIVVKC